MTIVLLISIGLVVMSIGSGLIVNSKSKLIINHYSKVSVINMGLLLAFTIVELIPIAAKLSHDGLIFVVLGILLPLIFHHIGHKSNGEQQNQYSIRILMIGACLHSLVDGSVMVTGLLLKKNIGAVIISSMLVHKSIELIMFSLILLPLVNRVSKLYTYLLSLSMFTVFGMFISISFVSRSEVFGELLGIIIALSAGIFIYMALTTISKEVECTKLKFASLYPFIGCTIYFILHAFIH